MLKFRYMSEAYAWCVARADSPCCVLDDNGFWARYDPQDLTGALLGVFADYGVVGGWRWPNR